MVGTDGPGDKLFRLVSDNAPSALDPLLNTPRSSGLSHVSEERFVPIIKDSGSSGAIGTISSSSTGTISDSLWSSGSIFHRFRAFPRDEGSQLDRVLNACGIKFIIAI